MFQQRALVFKQFRVGCIVIVALLIGATITHAIMQPARVVADTPQLPHLNAIYLADPGAPALDPQRAQTFGVRVVSSIPEMVANATGISTIIVDRYYFNQLDAAWLAAQLQAGRIIVGLNVPSAQLEGIQGYRQPRQPNKFVQDWNGRSFYSLIYQWHDANGGLQVGAASDVISSQDGLLARLYDKSQNAPTGFAR